MLCAVERHLRVKLKNNLDLTMEVKWHHGKGLILECSDVLNPWTEVSRMRPRINEVFKPITLKASLSLVS